jgi:hypothetical protein
MDVLISASKLIERLGREEKQLKQLGLHGHAAGVRAAITILIRESQEAHLPAPPSPSLDPST